MEKVSLPVDWETKTLGDICDIKTGKRDANHGNPNGKYHFFTCAKKHSYIDDYSFDTEAILVAGNGDVGAVKYFKGKFDAYQRTYILHNFKINVDVQLLFLLLNGYLKDVVSKQKLGNTMPYIKLGMLLKFPIILPPQAQQKQIVATLDKAFAAIDTAKSNAEQNLKNAKELFESYLQKVFENKGDDWEEKSLVEVTSKIGSGATPRGGKANYKEVGISLIRSMNVHDFYFKEKNLAFIDDEQADALSNVAIQEEDVLLNITGASIARCCIVPKECLPARVNQHVSIIRANKEVINPVFLASLLTSKFFKDQILEIGEQGATRQAITKVQLENFEISFPKTTKEQEKVVQNINTLKAETKKLEAIYTQKIADLEEMKKSVLQKAFSGQLNTVT